MSEIKGHVRDVKEDVNEDVKDVKETSKIKEMSETSRKF